MNHLNRKHRTDFNSADNSPINYSRKQGSDIEIGLLSTLKVATKSHSSLW